MTGGEDHFTRRYVLGEPRSIFEIKRSLMSWQGWTDEGGVRSNVSFERSLPDYARRARLRGQDESPSPPRTAIAPSGSVQVAPRRERQQAEMRYVLITSANLSHHARRER
jgi:hypothetical protein